MRIIIPIALLMTQIVMAESIVVTPRLWSAADTNVDLWFDAADASTITETAGFVSQWDDKSGNGNHAYQGVGADQPRYASAPRFLGLPAVFFDNDRMEFNGDLFTNTAYTIFIVECRNKTGDSYIIAGTNSQQYKNLHVGWRSETEWTLAQWSDDLNYTGFPLYTNQIARFWTCRNNPAVGKAIWLNGTLGATNTQKNTLLEYAGSAIGRRGTGGWYGGYIGEIIAVRKSVTEVERHLFEASLAWKWNLQSQLDASNPYKTTAPVSTGYKAVTVPVGGWTPADTNGLAIWFDAYDEATITKTNNIVYVWADKAGTNVAHQPNAAWRPTYVEHTKNFGGRPSIAFDGTDDLQYDGAWQTNTDYTVFVVEARISYIEGWLMGGNPDSMAQNSNFHIGWRGTTNQFAFAQWSNDLNWSNEYLTELNRYHLWTGTLNTNSPGGGKTLYLDGLYVAGHTNASMLYYANNHRIGSRNGTFPYRGNIAEIIGIPKCLTEAEREIYDAYLCHKWGIETLAAANAYKFVTPGATNKVLVIP